MAALLDKPERWRKRAEEIRTIADGMRDPEAKRFMLDLAKSYLITHDPHRKSYAKIVAPCRYPHRDHIGRDLRFDSRDPKYW